MVSVSKILYPLHPGKCFITGWHLRKCFFPKGPTSIFVWFAFDSNCKRKSYLIQCLLNVCTQRKIFIKCSCNDVFLYGTTNAKARALGAPVIHSVGINLWYLRTQSYVLSHIVNCHFDWFSCISRPRLRYSNPTLVRITVFNVSCLQHTSEFANITNWSLMSRITSTASNVTCNFQEDMWHVTYCCFNWSEIHFAIKDKVKPCLSS